MSNSDDVIRAIPQDGRPLPLRIAEAERAIDASRAMRVAQLELRNTQPLHVLHINRCIVEATAIADRFTGPAPYTGASRQLDGKWVDWAARWNRAYHAAMDRITQTRGLRTQSHQRKLREVH